MEAKFRFSSLDRLNDWRESDTYTTLMESLAEAGGQSTDVSVNIQWRR